VGDVAAGRDLLGCGDEASRIQSVTDDLTRRFGRADRPVPAHEVAAHMVEAISRYADARIRDFVPILAEKDVRDVLRQRAQA
jgi:hypothetical protein